MNARRKWWVEFWIGLSIFISVAAAIALPRSFHAQEVPPNSDAPGFWDLLRVNGVSYKWFTSLDEMTKEASVVIVGRITSVTPGRVFAPEPQYGDRAAAHYLNAALTVEEVLHGALAQPGAPKITLELFAPNAEAIPLVIANAPTDSAMFFLLNKAVHPATADLSPSDRAAESKYYEVLGEQAVLTAKDGAVWISEGIEDGQFPSQLKGQPFAEVALAVRRVP